MTRALLLLLWVATAWAQTAAVRGRQVVDDALKALGGDRFLAMQDRAESGRAYSFYREELSGLSVATIYTRYVTPVEGGLAVRERQSFRKTLKEINAVLLVDGKGYDITWRGARPLPDDSLERYRLTTLHNVFYILRVRLREPGLIFESRGLNVWMNQPVEVVDITDSENQITTVYFHQSTKFPVHQAYYRRDPKTRERIEEVTDFGKFRDVGGGVYWPFTIQRTRDGEKIYEMYSDTVTINGKLDDSLFVLPTGIKVLKKM